MAVSHPVFARVYQRMSAVMDRAGGADLRHALVAGLSGRVIEIAPVPLRVVDGLAGALTTDDEQAHVRGWRC